MYVLLCYYNQGALWLMTATVEGQFTPLSLKKKKITHSFSCLKNNEYGIRKGEKCATNCLKSRFFTTLKEQNNQNYKKGLLSL